MRLARGQPVIRSSSLPIKSALAYTRVAIPRRNSYQFRRYTLPPFPNNRRRSRVARVYYIETLLKAHACSSLITVHFRRRAQKKQKYLRARRGERARRVGSKSHLAVMKRKNNACNYEKAARLTSPHPPPSLISLSRVTMDHRRRSRALTLALYRNSRGEWKGRRFFHSAITSITGGLRDRARVPPPRERVISLLRLICWH